MLNVRTLSRRLFLEVGTKRKCLHVLARWDALSDRQICTRDAPA
jgi:hypothetical protein